jgi:hypothetical protein
MEINMLKKIKWRFKVRKDLKLLRKLDRRLNGDISISGNGNLLNFTGEKELKEKYKNKLDNLMANYTQKREIYSMKFLDKEIEECEKTYNKYKNRCEELQDRITALEFEIYGV